jgi:putative membrane protein
MIRFHAWLIPVLVTVGAAADLGSRFAGPAPTWADDATILSMLDRFYAGEAECSAVALAHATVPDVKSLAQKLGQDAQTLRASEREVVERLRLTPSLSQPSAVADSHAATLQDLKAMKSPDFDRAFVEHELTVHQYILDQLAKAVTGPGPSPEVKALLDKTTPVLKAHVDLAKSAKQQFNKAKA